MTFNRFLTRWQRDTRGPSAQEAWRDAALRLLTPALLLFCAIVAVGFVITGPLGDLPGEVAVNRALQDGLTSSPFGMVVTDLWSRLGNTEIIIGVCVVVVAILWWRTRQWWLAIVPAIAISVQSSVFVAASAIVGRERPDVDQLDPAPPTSGFPSGHVGASTALYVVLALLAQRIETPWLRRLVTGLCLLVPILVSVARIARGMHHLSDVIIGLLNGVVCAVLAWCWLRRRD